MAYRSRSPRSERDCSGIPTSRFVSVVQKQGFLVLDGGVGTTLQDRGMDVTNPIWAGLALLSDEGRAMNKKVHLDFLLSGSDVVTTNSYKLSRELLENLASASSLPENLTPADANEMLKRSVDIANEAVEDFMAGDPVGRERPLVVGSLGPWGNCNPYTNIEYTGEYESAWLVEKRGGVKVTEDEIADYHFRRIQAMCSASRPPDIYGAETMSSVLETKALVRAFEKAKVHGWICWTCQAAGVAGTAAPLEDCVAAAASSPWVVALGVNCLRPTFVDEAVAIIKKRWSGDIVVYPNTGENWDARKESRRWVGSREMGCFGDHVRAWWHQGVRCIGGCCRIGPEDISKGRSVLVEVSAEPSRPKCAL